MIQILSRVALGAYALLMVYLSLMPLSGPVGVEHSDKLAHLLAYGVFTLLAFMSATRQRQFLLGCVGIVLFGIAMEVLQSFIPGRQMSFWDCIANSLGVLLVLAASQVSSKKLA